MTLRLRTLLAVATISASTAIVASSVPASAAALTWNLQAALKDGGSATGTFDYDASSGTLSQFNIAATPGTSTGSVFPAFTYTPATATGSLTNGNQLELIATGRSFLALFSGALTNAGGTFSIVPSFSREEEPFIAGTALSRSVVSGTTSTSIPTPALLPGLIGLGVGVFRQKRKTASGESLS